MSAPKISKSDIYQKINIKEDLGLDIGDDRSLKEYIGQLLIDHIRSRTEAGIGMKFSSDGKGTPVEFKKYSKDYKESLPFKAFGKTDEVNMKLTGDMLGLLDIVDQDDKSITIGWSDESQIPKAFNHLTGDTLPLRPFFGVSKGELKNIVRDIKPDIKEASRVKREDGQDAYESHLAGLIDDLGDDDG